MAQFEVWSPYSAIMVDCFNKASSIPGISFRHCPRDANKVAHNLGKYAYDMNNSVFWEGDPPGFILKDVIDDVTLLINRH
jgi:hypothetical protein